MAGTTIFFSCIVSSVAGFIEEIKQYFITELLEFSSRFLNFSRVVFTNRLLTPGFLKKSKLTCIKNWWNRRSLSFTIRFWIILFSRSDKLYQIIPSSWRGGIEISMAWFFFGIVTFKLFIHFVVENRFWWIRVLFSRCITTNNS